MIVEAVEPPVVGFSLGFISGTDDVYVYVPEGSLALYQASFSWKDLNLQTFQPEETISGELLVRNIGANITRLDDISGKTFALYNVGRASYVYLGEDGDHQGLYVMSDNPQNRNTFIFTIEKTVDGKYKFKDVNNRYIPSLDDCGNISPSEDAGQFEITSLNDKWIIKDPSNNFYFNGNENGSTFNGWSNGTEANSQYEIRAVDAVVLPLEVSIIGESFDENTKWYRLKAGSSYVRYSKDDTSQIPAAGETPNGFDSYLWSFAKDVTGRYMIYNKAAGADKVMTSLPAEQNDVAVHFADKSTLGTDKNLTWDMYYSDAYSDRTGFRLGRKDDYTRSVSEQGGVLKFSGEKNELSTLEIEAVENPSLYLSTNNFYSFKSQATGKYISSEPNGTDEHLMVDEGNSLEKTSFYITDDFQLIGNTSQNMQGGTTPTSGADIYTFTPQPNGETFYIKPFSTGYLSASESTAVGYSNSRGKGCNWIIEPVNTDELKTSIRNAYPMMENTVGSWKPEAYKSFSQALESQEAGQIVEALRIANTPENLVTFSPSNFYRIMTSPKEDGWNGVVRYLTSTAGRLYGYDSDEQSASQIWKINEEEGSTYTLASQGVYSVAPVGTGTDVTSTEDKAAACRFTMEKRDGHITYGFKNGDMFLHLKKATINSDKTINGYDVEEDACFWYLIETKTIGLTISSSGYATINYPFAVEIPEGLTAYTGIASMNGGAGVFYMTEVSDGLIPANTPVILKGDPGEHTLTIITEDIPELTQESDLHGVLLSEVIPIDINAYVLDNIAEESNDFGFYKLEQGQRILGNNKAYMVPSFDNPANIKSFSIVFDDGPTTGIEDSATADTTQEEFYDLQGRRVLNPTKGIYVTRSGKKVIF